MPWGFVAAAAVGAVGSVVSSGNAEDAANNATEAQSRTASDQLALGREQLDWNKQIYADDKPLRDKAANASIGVMEQQIATQQKQNALADDYANYNKTTFRPLEQSIVQAAQGYDTPERRAEEVARASAGVEAGYTQAQQGLQRTLQRANVTPGSGRAIALMGDAAYTKAGAIAGATSAASRNVETIGAARMADAANLGRGLPSAQATAANLGINAGTSATGAGTAAIAQSASGIPAVNNGYSGAIQATGSAGNLYGQAASSFNSIANAGAAGLSGLGSAIGRIGGSGTGTGSGMMSSIGNWFNNTVNPYDGNAWFADQFGG